eukprot:EG_transcript_26891
MTDVLPFQDGKSAIVDGAQMGVTVTEPVPKSVEGAEKDDESDSASEDDSLSKDASIGTSLDRDASTAAYSVSGASTLLDKDWRRQEALKRRRIKGSRNSRRGVHPNGREFEGNVNKLPSGWSECPSLASRQLVKHMAHMEAQGPTDFNVN